MTKVQSTKCIFVYYNLSIVLICIYMILFQLQKQQHSYTKIHRRHSDSSNETGEPASINGIRLHSLVTNRKHHSAVEGLNFVSIYEQQPHSPNRCKQCHKTFNRKTNWFGLELGFKKIEIYARLGFLITFVIFNILYWAFLLFPPGEE